MKRTLFILLIVSSLLLCSSCGEENDPKVGDIDLSNFTDEFSDTDVPETLPEETVSETEAETEPPAPVKIPTVLEESEDAGEDYINSIIFLGDSRTYGLGYYKAVPWSNIWTPKNGTMYLGQASTDKIVYPEDDKPMVYKDAVRRAQPEILMISLGVDGIAAMSEAQFDAEFARLISDAREVSPDTVIILNAMFPVSSFYKSLGSINNPKIITGNAWIKKIAEKYEVHYLDSYSLLLDADGNLDVNYQNGDGIHLNKEGCAKFIEFVRTHALPGFEAKKTAEETTD